MPRAPFKLVAMRKLAIFGAVAACAASAVFGRVWQCADGRTVEGELYKASANTLRLKRGDGSKVDVRLRDLSEADRAYVRAQYPEFFAGRKNAAAQKDASSADDAAADVGDIEDNPQRVVWPRIQISPENIAFRLDPKRGRFYTRHYCFDMKKKLSTQDAKRLGHLCELTYESVHAFPFWPSEFIRNGAGVRENVHKKFMIEVDSVEPRYAGVYRASDSGKGEILQERVNVEPEYIAKHLQNPEKPSYAGTLPHELCHQLLSLYGGTVCIREGVAQYMQTAVYCKDVMVFPPQPSLRPREKPLVAPGLKKTILMGDEVFHRSSGETDHYALAYLVFNYFASQEPAALKAFLSEALSPRFMGEETAILMAQQAFPLLLNGRSESEIEANIIDYYQAHGVAVRFR